MDNQQPRPEQPEQPENPFKVSIQITQAHNGDLGIQFIGQGVRFVEIRRMLEWALNRTNDEIHTELTKAILQESLDKKVKQNGFRPLSIRGIFGK